MFNFFLPFCQTDSQCLTTYKNIYTFFFKQFTVFKYFIVYPTSLKFIGLSKESVSFELPESSKSLHVSENLNILVTKSLNDSRMTSSISESFTPCPESIRAPKAYNVAKDNMTYSNRIMIAKATNPKQGNENYY